MSQSSLFPICHRLRVKPSRLCSLPVRRAMFCSSRVESSYKVEDSVEHENDTTELPGSSSSIARRRTMPNLTPFEIPSTVPRGARRLSILQEMPLDILFDVRTSQLCNRTTPF